MPLFLWGVRMPGDFRLGVWWVRLSQNTIQCDGRTVRLEPKMVEVLVCLAEHAGETVSKEKLIGAVWGDTFVTDDVLTRCISELRKALDDDAKEPRVIQTIPKRGYRLLAKVESVTPPPPRPSKVRWTWAVAPLVVGVLAAALWWMVLARPLPKVTGINQITRDGIRRGSWKLRVLTDGVRLYLTEWTEGRNQLFQVSAAGGVTAPIATQLLDAVPQDISPDSSELLLASTQGLEVGNDSFWILPLPTGAPRRLPFTARSAAWSPDGQQLAVCKGSDLYIAKHDGTELHRLLSDLQTPSAARFSPDGARIRFTQSDPAQATQSLWEVRADGAGLHAVLPGWHDPPSECCGKWTADGRYYAFQSTNPSGTNIWVLPEQGELFRRDPQRPIQLSTGPLSYTDFEFDKNGRKLFVIGKQRRGELVRYDPRTKVFIPLLGGISAGDLDFSRDGQWVTYVTYPDELLWRSRVDGSELLQLSYSPQQAALPRWSPDGKQIAFVARQVGRPWKIFLVSAQGGSSQELLPENFNEVDPSWSSEGAHLAFGRLSNSGEAQGIFVVALKTRQVSTVPRSEGLFSPRWSPYGRFLAAIPSKDQGKLMLFDFQTQKWSEWTRDVGQMGFISWSPDEKHLYFDTLRSTNNFFNRVRLGQHQVEPTVDLKGINRFLGPWGQWSGIMPDGSPILVRDSSVDEIYAIDVQWP